MATAWTGRRWTCLWTFFSLALLPCWVQVQAQSLASIPVDAAPQVEAPAEATASPVLRARVYVADVPGLARLVGLPEPKDAATRYLDVDLAPGAHAPLESPADPLAASFIVDYDHPTVGKLSQQLAAEQALGPVGGGQIVAFVAKSMHSSYAANANLASEVARSLQGDCTEHALLTAALARSARIPARLVQGAALVYADGQWQAYGHAWVQTNEAGRWTVRDSALAGWSGPVYYVPAFVVGDEGPGYKLDMIRGFSRMPARIQLLGPGDTEPAR
jgi:transglutaminase-like putative cysteine protease